MTDASPLATLSANVEEIRALGAELLDDLAECVGDQGALSVVAEEWLDAIDAETFSSACVVALGLVFRDCLSVVEQVHPGQTSFTRPEGIP